MAFVPVIALGICCVIYLAQRKTLLALVKAGAADESGLQTLTVRLKHNMFLAVFLVYPTITTTLVSAKKYQCYSEKLRPVL